MLARCRGLEPRYWRRAALFRAMRPMRALDLRRISQVFSPARIRATHSGAITSPDAIMPAFYRLRKHTPPTTYVRPEHSRPFNRADRIVQDD